MVNTAQGETCYSHRCPLFLSSGYHPAQNL